MHKKLGKPGFFYLESYSRLNDILLAVNGSYMKKLKA
jgi:hypothetical protein|nr:MAG TPA: hypothetical protein [Caudoviricetes sp.]